MRLRQTGGGHWERCIVGYWQPTSLVDLYNSGSGEFVRWSALISSPIGVVAIQPASYSSSCLTTFWGVHLTVGVISLNRTIYAQGIYDHDLTYACTCHLVVSNSCGKFPRQTLSFLAFLAGLTPSVFTLADSGPKFCRSFSPAGTATPLIAHTIVRMLGMPGEERAGVRVGAH